MLSKHIVTASLLLASFAPSQTRWLQITVPSPPPQRSAHSLAHDSARNRTVMFGGSGALPTSTTRMNDTWEFDGIVWTQRIVGTAPPGRWRASMSYNDREGKIVLFGGSGPALTDLNDTWTWDGTDWVEQFPTRSPRERNQSHIAYDAARARTVIYGGWNGSTLLDDLWEWDGKNWTEIQTAQTPAIASGSMVYDRKRGRLVLVGVSQRSRNFETWELVGNDWIQVLLRTEPPRRTLMAMAYDRERGRTVLFGGGSSPYPESDTWEYDGANWIQATRGTRPRGRYGSGIMTYDVARKRMVLFGGRRNYRNEGDTWEFASQMLHAAPSHISIATGARHFWDIDASPAHAGRQYWVVGTLSGTTPGVPIGTPSGTVTVPLNPDAWTEWTLAAPNSLLLTKSRGKLDSNGFGEFAVLEFPVLNDPSAVGRVLHHAFFVYDGQGVIHAVSNPAPLFLVK